MLAHTARDYISHGEQIGAAMVIDDAFRVAGRARGVVERDCVPLVLRSDFRERWIADREKRLVLDLAEPLAAGSA